MPPPQLNREFSRAIRTRIFARRRATDPPGIGPVTLFADIHDKPQGKFLEGGALDKSGNFWFVAISSGWVSYLTPDAKLVPVFNCNPRGEIGPACEPQGTRWHDGKLYVTTRHLGILL